MSKQVPLSDHTNMQLDEIVDTHRNKAPHVTISKKGVVADLVFKEFNKIKKGDKNV